MYHKIKVNVERCRWNLPFEVEKDRLIGDWTLDPGPYDTPCWIFILHHQVGSPPVFVVDKKYKTLNGV